MIAKTHEKIKTNTNCFHLFVISLHKNLLTFLFCAFAICLIFFSKTNLVAAKNGLTLWATAVVPSLFPFFVATELLSYTNIIRIFGKVFSKMMRPLFGVPGEAAFAFLMGLMSGYPVGAKITVELVENGICTKEEGERMLAFTNNSGPLFILGTVGITLFGNSTIGFLLLATHILAGITVGMILNFFSKKTTSLFSYSVSKLENSKQMASFSSLGNIFQKSIQKATATILLIGGFVVIFSVILSILEQSGLLHLLCQVTFPFAKWLGYPTSLLKPFFAGVVELTNGVKQVSTVSLKAISFNIITSAFLLGFGGLCVLLQVFSIASKANLSIKKYLIGKLLQGLFAAIYTAIAFAILPSIHLDLANVIFASQYINLG